ncbi:MAG: hypothetical protein J0H54_00400, partial [Rhizobiales bacterium]|nr:hypothetical protein [Hyphomicrobiales bacterium]
EAEERRRRGRTAAIALLALVAGRQAGVATGDALAALGIARSSLHRMARILAAHGLLDLSVRGRLSPGPLAVRLALRREAALCGEDERRLAPRGKKLARAPGASYALLRHADCVAVQATSAFRRAPKFRLGFSNASIDHPWRRALVHSVEYGAVRHAPLVASLPPQRSGAESRRCSSIAGSRIC